MEIQDRIHYISDEEGKMWEVREFFLPCGSKRSITVTFHEHLDTTEDK